MENANTFGAQARHYASARPSYPRELFDWISTQAPTNDLAWDVGTGSGQAALSLTDRFSRVHATDMDEAQIAQAKPHPKIQYVTGVAQNSALSNDSVDTITVATALHWFDLDLFWKEVSRVAKPGAVFCAWTYHRAEADDDIQNYLLNPIKDVIAPYWSDGNRLSWRGYSKDELAMPFEVLTTPRFVCNLQWTALQISAFVRSWSTYKKATLTGHADILSNLEDEALSKLGDKPRSFALPLNILAARIDE